MYKTYMYNFYTLQSYPIVVTTKEESEDKE